MSPANKTDSQEGSFKQRLVGAMVLVALVVIFVPMVLDFRKNDNRVISGSNIPPKPEDFRVEVLPLHAPDQMTAVAGVPGESTVEITTINDSSMPLVKKAIVPEGVSTVKQVESVAKESDIKPDIKVSKSVSVPPIIKEVLKITSTLPEPVTWDIQVGSFNNEENAMQLRDRLRKQGYSAFIVKTTVENQASFRVRVGPELSKSRAEKLREKMEQELDMNGIVMVH